ncbi:MAG: toll/interleukin-1 receptor domain-containing protein [Flavobacteriales bacterium]
MAKQLRVFVSYAHEDNAMKEALGKHLTPLKRSNKIKLWSDIEISPGQEWDHAIKSALLEADIILLLISPDFNNSQYIWDNELQTALQHHQSGTASVIPIILRSCDWTEMPYAKLQALPSGGKAVTSFADHDVAYTNIVAGVKIVVARLENMP